MDYYRCRSCIGSRQEEEYGMVLPDPDASENIDISHDLFIVGNTFSHSPGHTSQSNDHPSLQDTAHCSKC